MGSGRVDSRELASSPPPGFGPAAARPARAHSAGTTSAARTGMLVDVKIQAGYADLESLRNAGNRNASPKGRKRKFGVDATKGESAGVNASNTGEHLRSCRKGKGQGKHARQLAKEGISALHRGQNLQIDQPNTSSSSLPQGQCSDKEGISTNYQREEKLVNQSSIPVDQWVLLGVALSASEKDALKEFASLTSSILAEEWDKTVTHVIVGRDAGSACGRSHEVKFFDGLGTSIDGPTKGRARAAEGARKLFSGLRFCLSAFMHPEDRKNIQNLIAAGEGQVLEGMSPDWLRENLNRNPAEVYFIYDGGPPRKPTLDFDLEVQETVEYVESGAQVIRHQQLFDAILSYDRRILEPTSFFTKIRK
ncbi:hypothetical protein ZWY2020_009498 [Hordeum vulgare]|nr:hypothetical protein ZWY2020_009498 [Hordeum vulgare]